MLLYGFEIETVVTSNQAWNEGRGVCINILAYPNTKLRSLNPDRHLLHKGGRGGRILFAFL